MPIFDRFRSLFKGGPAPLHQRRPLPSVIEYNVDPQEFWTVLGELGDGAFGKVEKVASKQDPQMLAAAKRIEIEEGENIEDFLVEIEILTQCKHENIVGLLACYFYDGKLSMMLEFCAGGAIDSIMIDLEKPLSEPQIAYVTKKVCQALEYLHSNYVIHRDLKAGNILLSSDATVKLADFGVSAKMKDKNERRDSFIGTPYWMAPEVMICETFKDQPYNCLADIWSLGITLIEMAQMDPPNYQVSPMRVVIKVQKSDPPTLDKPSRWSVYFNDFIAKCLVKAPADRYSAPELLTHPFIKDVVNKKPIVQLLSEKNAEILEEVVIDEESSTGGSVADSEEQFFDFEPQLNEPQSHINQVSEKTVSKQNATTLQNSNVSGFETYPFVSELNGKDGIQEGKQLYLKKKTAAPKPPEHETSLEPKQEKYFGQSNSNENGQQESYPSKLTSLIITDLPTVSTETSNGKTLSSNSSNALSPSGQEAIDILDDLYNALDDQSKMDQQSLTIRSSQSFEMINDSWITALPEPNDNDNNVSTTTESNNTQHELKNITESDQSSTVDDEEESLNIQQTIDRSSSEEVKPICNEGSKNSDSHENIHASVITNTNAHIIATTGRLDSGGIFFKNPYSVDNIPPPEPPVDYDEKPRRQPYIQNLQGQLERKALKSFKTEIQQRLQQPYRAASFDSSYVLAAAGVDSATLNNNDEMRRSSIPTQKPKISMEVVPGGHHLVNNQSSLLATAQMCRKSPQRATVTKKTRSYVVDGVEVTSTTLHVLGVKQDYELRKKKMRDLKRMQREEARQQQELSIRAEQLRDQQERKFATEKQTVHKTYENDIESLSRIQKKKMEEMERIQEEELKNVLKKIHIDQERDLRFFREHLRQEQKTLKQEVDLLPKSQRKEVYRCRKELLDKSHYEREADFLIQLEHNQELYMCRIREKNREKMADVEREFLKQKHSLERSLESALWELEERQLAEKHNLIAQQFRDVFHLQRTHMLVRHQKELEHIRKVNQSNEENLLRALTVDRKGLPKALRNESKTRSIMFKESLRIDLPGESVEKWAEKIHEFEEKEKSRIKMKMEEYDLKCKRRLAQLVLQNQNVVKELEEIHNEKRNMLVGNERAKLVEYENEYRQVVQEWKAGLSVRKSALETKFAEELKTQERFYNLEGNTGDIESNNVVGNMQKYVN